MAATPRTFANWTDAPVVLRTWHIRRPGFAPASLEDHPVARGAEIALPPSSTGEYVVCAAGALERLGKFSVTSGGDGRFAWVRAAGHAITWAPARAPIQFVLSRNPGGAAMAPDARDTCPDFL